MLYMDTNYVSTYGGNKTNMYSHMEVLDQPHDEVHVQLEQTHKEDVSAQVNKEDD